MLLPYLLIGLLCLWGIGLRKESDGDYLSREQGNAVKGIFILMVLVSHSNQYVADAGYAYSRWSDSLFLQTGWLFGQLVVVMFLFFSGYGVMTAVRNKGEAYVRAMPRHRILSVLLSFDIAVVCFALAGLLLGKTYPAGTYLLALTGWESIGNSNWYIFVILLCYLATWMAAKVSRSALMTLVLTTVLLGGAYAALSATKEAYWYNTLAAYPFGMVVCLLKGRLDSLGRVPYWSVLSLSVLLLALTYTHHEDPFQLVYSARGILFATVIVLLLMKVRVGNPALEWLGRNLFPIYVYQRLPMMVLAFFNPFGILTECPVVFVLASTALTLLLVPLTRRLQVRL